MKRRISRMIGCFYKGRPNPMITPLEINQIRSLHQAGVPIKRIVSQTGIARNTVRRYIKEEVTQASHKDRVFMQEHGERIRELFIKCDANCVVLQRVLAEEFNQQISLRQLQRFCEPFRQELKAVKQYSRYETAPGQQMQIDFAEKNIMIGTEVTKVHFFVAVLSYSRRIFAKAYPTENQSVWLDGIESAFRFFDGIPMALLSDNTRCLITEHRKKGEYKFTSGYWYFCHYWNIKPIASSPYHPQSKGKVERAVRYIKENALVGKDFSDLIELNQWLEQWSLRYADNRKIDEIVQGLRTPKERYWVEKSYLREMDKPRVAAIREETRKVDSGGLIRIDNCFYRLPSELINKDVQILTDDTTIVVSRKGVFVMELDKASSVYRPAEQKEKEKSPDIRSVNMDERYCRNTLQRPLSDYSKITGVW